MKLFKPDGYEPKETCNGCGTGWSASIIPNTIYFLNIKECCCIHDYMYEAGSTIEHKKEADRVFLNNMLRIINDKEAWYFPHFLARYRAIEYYNAVVNFGGAAFWDNKPIVNT
jgi:hypothetical protein